MGRAVDRDLKPPPAEENPSPGSQEKVNLRVQPGQHVLVDARVDPKGKVTVRRGFMAALTGFTRSGKWFVWLALAFTGIVLFTGLTRFPAQVIPDEVYPSLRAVDLLQNGFKGEDGTLLPVFLPGSTPFAVGTGAFWQTLPQFFRPNTLGWIRGLNALLSLLSALLLAAWLVYGLRLKDGWVLLPLLAGIPAWFYFSRTGLDITLAAAITTAALGFYAFYRIGKVKYLYASVVCAMLAFYAAPAARLAVPAAVILLALADWRYHRENRKVVLRAALLAAILALPLGSFLRRHSGALHHEWLAAGSFLAADLAAGIKIGRFLLNTLNAFNPFFWFLPDPNAVPYYRMGTFPALPYLMAPFTAAGTVFSLRRLRQPEYRLLWLGWLAAAAGAAPYGGRMPELLPAVPVLAVMTVLGLQQAVEWLRARWKRMPARAPAVLLLVGAGLSGVLLLVSALLGPARGQADYGRNGLQYGAPQIFGAAVKYAQAHPGKDVLIWPEWSSDPEALRRFFAPEANDRVRLGMVDSFLYKIDSSIAKYAFVIPDDQYAALQASNKFIVTTVEQIAFPDGSPAFALVELAYTPRAAEIIEMESIRRRELESVAVMLDGELITVRHSRLDLGAAENLFDGNRESLARSAEANPLVIELVFARPRRIDGVLLQLGSEPVTVTAVVNPGGEGARTVKLHGDAVDGMKELGLDFGEDTLVEVLRLEVLDETAGEPAHVHLWELILIDP